MEKGFSDGELADIMNEIENLEKEFSGESEAEERIFDHEHHQVLSELAQMTVDEATQMEQEHSQDNVQKFTHKSSQEHSSLFFKISGQMQLELGFEVGGANVVIHVDEESGLVVEMEGGMKFHLPVKTKNHLKKAS